MSPPLDFEGRVELLTVESELLQGNALGDPHVRELAVYVPPDLPGNDTAEGLPIVLILAGYTGRGQSYLDTHPWRRGVVWHYDRAVAAGEAAPAILVLPDCFTKLGGSQYVNSSAVGRYADHLIRELVPRVERDFRTNGRRGVVGKSSGGFGALHLAMNHPGFFRACASISGDVAFEHMFPPEFLACLRGLVPHEMQPARFLERFFEKPDLSGDGHAVIIVLAMAACYSPNPASSLGFDLPFTLDTGERIQEVWERWLAFDPLIAVEAHAEALRELDLLHVECGLNDEFHLQWGTRMLARRLSALRIEHTHEEHDGGHRGIDHRYGPLLAKLATALT